MNIPNPSNEQSINTEMISAAETLIGLTFTAEERTLMLEGVNHNVKQYDALRAVKLENHVPPALQFNPLMTDAIPPKIDVERCARPSSSSVIDVPTDLEELAFCSVTQLAPLIEGQKLSAQALTEMYLNRLKRYGSKLNCVITLTEELALEQAKRADAEIRAGHYRGPLHGIPWGAKDLLATKGYPTTWGAMPYKDQVIDQDATVVQRLEEAGAVLVAKLSMGALAWGDVWFGGKTKSPWNLEEGSSGSSAGSGAATAAGLAGFAIGTETHGSIVSPSTQCGLSGLRPTFGRVSRAGAMALSWSMDKIGPMCRSVEDCAIVFDAIRGTDGQDLSVVNRPFHWQPQIDLAKLRIGYVQSAFEEEREYKSHDEQTLDTLRELGATLLPIELPEAPFEAIRIILSVEAAAAFDELTRTNQDDLLVRQEKNAWPNRFRQSRLIPAVEYVQANRIRTQVIQAMAILMSGLDLYVAPSLSGDNLLLTNLTGHPAVVVPNGFKQNGMPTSITFTGGLYEEALTLAVAKAYQDSTDFHLKHPANFQ